MKNNIIQYRNMLTKLLEKNDINQLTINDKINIKKYTEWYLNDLSNTLTKEERKEIISRINFMNNNLLNK